MKNMFVHLIGIKIILLYKADGVFYNEIAARLNISSRTLRLFISKFKEVGIDGALFDAKHLGRLAKISE